MTKSICLLASVVLLTVFGWMTVDRMIFLKSARRTEGRIVRILGEDSTCGGKRRYDCTLFNAHITYTPAETGRAHTIETPAGQTYGHFQSTERATRKVGEVVTVAYNPKRPAEAYEDTLYDIWRNPGKVLICHVVALFFGAGGSTRRYAALDLAASAVD